MTHFIDIRVGVSDDEFVNFLNRLASSAVSISATDEDGEGISLQPTGDLDATGVPWLESVHAKTKTQTQEKRWKRGKGITEEQRDAAEAAWRAQNGGGQAQVQQPVAGLTIPQVQQPVAGVALPTTTAPQAQVQQTASIPGLSIPGMAPAPVLPVVTPDVPATLDDVAKVFETLSARFPGQITAEFVGNIYRQAGVSDPQMMTDNETARRSVIKVINEVLEANPAA